MPKDYIARLVYDRSHVSMAIVKQPLEVLGYVDCLIGKIWGGMGGLRQCWYWDIWTVCRGITYRPFKGRQFAEIVFCAISSDQQVKGYGAHLMSHLKVRRLGIICSRRGGWLKKQRAVVDGNFYFRIMSKQHRTLCISSLMPTTMPSGILRNKASRRKYRSTEKSGWDILRITKGGLLCSAQWYPR